MSTDWSDNEVAEAAAKEADRWEGLLGRLSHRPAAAPKTATCHSMFRWTQWLTFLGLFERKLETTVFCQRTPGHEGTHRAYIQGREVVAGHGRPDIMEVTW